MIRCADLVIAEHPQASQAGSSVAAPEHLQAIWKKSLERVPVPSAQWQVRFDQSVAATPLSVYQEVLA